MIQYQILQINITRTIQQTVGRITNENLGMKELKFTPSLPIPLQPAVTPYPYPAGPSTYLTPLSPFPSLQKWHGAALSTNAQLR